MNPIYATQLAAQVGYDMLGPIIFGGIGVIGGWFLKVFSDHIAQRQNYYHRLRLEKEYSLYSALWEKLFDLRLGVSLLVYDNSNSIPPDITEVIESFDAYKNCVRRNEPFMASVVWTPGRELEKNARTVLINLKKLSELEQEVREDENPFPDERRAEKRLEIEAENDLALKEVEKLFEEVREAIRNRVKP